MATLEEVDEMESLEELVVTNDSEILISMIIDGKVVFQEIGINIGEAMRLLKSIGYGGIGWEEYNIVDEDGNVPSDY